MTFALMMLVAGAIDALVGWPEALFRRIGHPVTWIGALITRLEVAWNHPGPGRARRGMAATLLVIAAAALPAWLVQLALPRGWAEVLVGGVLAWPLVAARSLHAHVAAVARPLLAGDLGAARRAVAMIVGRDPEQLDTAGVTRAALESLAENTSDGIIAPLFWGVALGLPGIAAYKAINTLDSMIAHRNARFEEFGRAAAHIDDVANLLPARLSGVLFGLAAGRGAGRALDVMERDARRHRSPNAGWPEAALAGALGVRLSGPRIYGDRIAEEPWLNGAAPDPAPAELARGLVLYRRVLMQAAGLIAFVAWAGSWF